MTRPVKSIVAGDPRPSSNHDISYSTISAGETSLQQALSSCEPSSNIKLKWPCNICYVPFDPPKDKLAILTECNHLLCGSCSQQNTKRISQNEDRALICPVCSRAMRTAPINIHGTPSKHSYFEPIAKRLEQLKDIHDFQIRIKMNALSKLRQSHQSQVNIESHQKRTARVEKLLKRASYLKAHCSKPDFISAKGEQKSRAIVVSLTNLLQRLALSTGPIDLNLLKKYEIKIQQIYEVATSKLK